MKIYLAWVREISQKRVGQQWNLICWPESTHHTCHFQDFWQDILLDIPVVPNPPLENPFDRCFVTHPGVLSLSSFTSATLDVKRLFPTCTKCIPWALFLFSLHPQDISGALFSFLEMDGTMCAICPNLDAGNWATWPPKACIRLGQKASSCLWLGEYSTGDVRNVSFSIDRIAGATSKCLNTWMLSVTSVLAALTSYLLQVSSCWYLDGRPAVSALCFPSSWVSFSFMKCSSVSTERDIPTERARIWEYPFLSLGKYLPWQSRKQNWDLSHPRIKYSSHSQQCSSGINTTLSESHDPTSLLDGSSLVGATRFSVHKSHSSCWSEHCT